VRWLFLDGRWVNLLQRNDTVAELKGPGLHTGRSYLRNDGSAGLTGWTAWRSTLQPTGESITVASDQIAYSAYQNTSAADVRPRRGQTFVALAWVKGSGGSAGGQISLSLRENGRHSPETESNAFWPLSTDWQPVWVARTVEGDDVKYLSLHLLKISDAPEADSFQFRDVQLMLVSE